MPPGTPDLPAIMKLAASQQIVLEVSDEPMAVSEDLRQYDALVFLGSIGASLNKDQQRQVEAYVYGGGGLMGLQAELADSRAWPWYSAMYQQPEESRDIRPVSQSQNLEDEGLRFRNREYSGGRVALLAWQPGKVAGFEASFLSGLSYVTGAAGSLPADGQQAGADKRFHRRVLHKDLKEGLKLAIAQDGTVYYIERGGKIFKLAPEGSEMGAAQQVGSLPVSTVSGMGLLGMALDPGFADNRLVYLFYTPEKATSLHQKVSRFRLGDKGLERASEKVLLTIPYDYREDGHTGGAMLFDDKGNLFISTGDNTNPHEANGFGPLDDRPGRNIFDAQRTAGNTNNLLGKILRIHPQPDGSYTIPEGNLFPDGKGQERPEIYVMGCRNPYSLSYDTRTGFLYWGEVGPDAGRDSTRGSRGYDEINQVRKAGFFGWPYFTGENKAYADYDFATQKLGKFFDPAAPLNKSTNNTGRNLLPPAQPAFISYPYTKSDKFPRMGEGTRCAIAGPVYHYNPDLESETKFPAEYDNVLFIADWSRKWIMAVHMDAQGHYSKSEPFMPLTTFDRPLDLKFGPDGALYLLEYGEPWGMFKTYGTLVRIEHHAGNRPPLAIATASDTVGREPLTVKFSSRGSKDFDGDEVKMQWTIGGKKLAAQNGEPAYTFQHPGQYIALLTVTDSRGLSSQDWIRIQVGNSRPQLQISSRANQSFYWDHLPFDYQVKVQDQEDGAQAAQGVQVELDYLPEGKDVAGLFIGSEDIQQLKAGKGSLLMAKSDCKTCHSPDKPALGPSLRQIAGRYSDNQATVDMLAKKVISGGGGMWGSFSMSAHPQISRQDAAAMVRYILSLDKQTGQTQSLPLQGQLHLKRHAGNGNEGLYIFTASYTDKGRQGLAPLSVVRQVRLRHPRVDAASYDKARGVARVSDGQGGTLVSQVQPGGYISFRNTDLSQVSQLTFNLEPGDSKGYIELHLGSPQGPVVSRLVYPAATRQRQRLSLQAPLQATAGKQDLYFVFGGGANKQHSLRLHSITFEQQQPQQLVKAGKFKSPSRS
ncbi:MAG: PQQ-dependent sugar dehydrogenase [Adhaeribacter sp.]